MAELLPEEDAACEVDSESVDTDNVVALKQSLAEEKEKAAANLAGWQRAQADFINYKRRAEQEKEELGKFANATLMLSILPVLDDMERAFTAIPPNLDKLGWVDGLRLIERKLSASLEAQGLTQIKALGEPFDPNLHEAVMYGQGQEGMVVEEIQKGYKLYERVIRPTMVVVGSGEGAVAEDKEE